MSTLADRRQRVLLELGNRSDLSASVGGVPSRIDQWLTDSYTEVTMGYDFAELEFSTTNQVILNQDSLAFPDDARMIKAITFYYLDGTPVIPEIKNMQVIRQYNSKLNGPPSVLGFFNLKVFMRPIPDRTYNVVIDYWQLPQIDTTSPTDPGPTELLLPLDWLEVVDYGAMMRGHAELQEADKAASLQNLLYGTSNSVTGQTTPGLMASKMTRRMAQAPAVDYGMRPKTAYRSFTNVRG